MRSLRRSSGLAGWLLVAMLVWAPPVGAMSCPAPAPWFLTRISLDPAAAEVLPGVSVTTRSSLPTTTRMDWDSSSFNAAASRAASNRLVLSNSGQTPLYQLLEKAKVRGEIEAAGYIDAKGRDLVAFDLPRDRVPIRKVVGGLSYEWSYQSQRWENVGVELHVVDGLGGVSPGFENRVTFEGTRPADAVKPAAQEGELLLGYGDRLIRLPFTVEYVSNTAFIGSTCGFGSGLYTLMTQLCLGFFVLAVAFFWVVGRLLRNAERQR